MKTETDTVESGEAPREAHPRDPARPGSEWPRCRARTRVGGRCRAEGSGIHGLCIMHCGATLTARWRDPIPVFGLRIDTSGVHVSPNRAARTWRRPVWPQRVRPWVAVRLVTSGQVTRALVVGRRGKWLLAELVRLGVQVTEGARQSDGARRYSFEAPARNGGEQ